MVRKRMKLRRATNKPALLANALRYAEMGLSVIPVHNPINGQCSCGQSNCTSIGKHPRISAWPQKASSDPETIRSWWKRWPQANIGLATGNTFAVLDVDKKNGGLDSLKSLEEEIGGLPDTVRVDTGGGGRHYYFQKNSPINNSAGALGPGLDVRGTGGFIVAPPSLHLSGKRYRYSKNIPFALGHIAPLPDEILRRLAPPACARSAERVATSLHPSDRIGEGERNDTLARVIGHLLRRDIDAHMARTLIHALNQTNCSPPLSGREVDQTIDSIARRELQRRGQGAKEYRQ